MLNLSLLVAALRTTAPILLVALGGAFTTKAGIFNIGLEGQMLVASFAAILGSIATGSAWAGVLCGVLAATLLSLIFAAFVVSFRANEVVVGLALNILAGGLTISLMKAIFGHRGSVVGHGIVGLAPLRLPWAGRLLSGYTPLVYIAFALVPVLAVFFRHARLGLHMRVAGEAPEAAEALGLSIPRLRYTAAVFCGVLAGLAGAHLSLGYITMFTENMSSGRGFMAVAVLIFSTGDPVKILAGCLLFGFADALSLRLQTFGVPSYLVLMVPYLVALLVLFALSFGNRRRILRETLASMALYRATPSGT